MGHKNCARVARPSLRVLVMQYIQRCGGSGLVHETSAYCAYMVRAPLVGKGRRASDSEVVVQCGNGRHSIREKLAITYKDFKCFNLETT